MPIFLTGVHPQVALEEAQWETWGPWTHGLTKIDLKHQTTSSKCSCFTWTIPSTNTPKSSLKLVCQLVKWKGKPLSLHLMPEIYCFSCKLKFLFQVISQSCTFISPLSHLRPWYSNIVSGIHTDCRGLVEENGKVKSPGMYSKKTFTCMHKKTSVEMLFVALFVSSKNLAAT